jgi:hypothetical protein
MSKTDRIKRMLAKGWSATTIAKKLGVNNAFVHTVKWQTKKAAQTTWKVPQMKVDKKASAKKPTKLIVKPENLDDALRLLKLEEDGVTLRPWTETEKKTLDDAWTFPDNVNHPPHYTSGGIETIDFIEAKDLNYRLGNVVKYVSRAEKKGDPIENLKKARWYLDREISVRERA